VADLSPVGLSEFLAALGLEWTFTGMVWAVGVKWAEGSPHALLRLPLVLIIAWAVCLASSIAVFRIAHVGGAGMDRLMMNVPAFDLAAYLLWANLFYGGLYTIGYFATQRTLRLRRKLAELRLARNEAETRLREIRLQTLRGQIQPATLLEALDTLRARYAKDIVAGHALFDKIIDFLRAAMPGLRSGASTLAAEFAVLDAYAALREALDDAPPPWVLSLADAPADLTFPPLRLLPVLDQLSRNAPTASRIEVHAASEADNFVVKIAALSPLMEEDALRRLRRDAQSALGFGSAANEGGEGIVATLRFPKSASPPRPPVLVTTS
jgi:hypothetical protein